MGTNGEKKTNELNASKFCWKFSIIHTECSDRLTANLSTDLSLWCLWPHASTWNFVNLTRPVFDLSVKINIQTREAAWLIGKVRRFSWMIGFGVSSALCYSNPTCTLVLFNNMLWDHCLVKLTFTWCICKARATLFYVMCLLYHYQKLFNEIKSIWAYFHLQQSTCTKQSKYCKKILVL